MFCLKCAPNRIVSDYFISQKSFSFWGSSFPKPHTKVYNPTKFSNSITSKYYYFHDSGIWTILLFISNNCFKYAPKWMVSSLIFLNCSVEGFTEPHPQTSTHAPLFFSRTLPSVLAFPSLALNSRRVARTRALDSGFALYSRAHSTSIRVSPSTFDWGSWFSPNKFLDLPVKLAKHLLLSQKSSGSGTPTIQKFFINHF